MKNKNYEIPLGLAKELYQNNDAMANYSNMTKEQRINVQKKANKTENSSEIQRIVQNIADGEFNN